MALDETEYRNIAYTDDIDVNDGLQIITLEVMSDSSTDNGHPKTNTQITESQESQETTGVHFLTETEDTKNENDTKDSTKGRSDLLEYMIRNDGSVVCKLCGEILQSRTHWYRHKYKLHVIQPLNPTPLFQCDQCLVYFKSRKGYIGHIASRHSEILADANPVIINSQTEDNMKETPTQSPPKGEVKEASDPELAIPKSSVPNYEYMTNTTAVKQAPAQPKPAAVETKKNTRGSKEGRDPNSKDWEEKRSREEKLVADIIDRVRKECEAQGTDGGTRRGYSRRTTVMHT